MGVKFLVRRTRGKLPQERTHAVEDVCSVSVLLIATPTSLFSACGSVPDLGLPGSSKWKKPPRHPLFRKGGMEVSGNQTLWEAAGGLWEHRQTSRDDMKRGEGCKGCRWNRVNPMGSDKGV